MIKKNKLTVIFCLLTINIFGCREQVAPQAVLDSFIEAFDKEDCRKLSSILINYHELANYMYPVDCGLEHILEAAIRSKSPNLVRILLYYGANIPQLTLKQFIVQCEKNEADSDLYEILEELLLYDKDSDYIFDQYRNKNRLVARCEELFVLSRVLFSHLENYKQYCEAYNKGILEKRQWQVLKKLERDSVTAILKMAPDVLRLPQIKYIDNYRDNSAHNTREITYPLYKVVDYDMLKLLLDFGANPDSLNGEKQKRTLLFDILQDRSLKLFNRYYYLRDGKHDSVAKIDYELRENILMIELLLKSGADVDTIQNKKLDWRDVVQKIETAREFIQRQEWQDILKLIENVNALRADKLFDVLEQDVQIPAEVAAIAAQYIDGKNENKYYYQV